MALSDLLNDTAANAISNLYKTTEQYIELEKIIPSVNDLLVDQAEDLRKLNKELGTGNKTVAQFRGEIGKLSKQIGVSKREVYELLESTNKYHQGIKNTTKATMMFSRAVGEMPKSLGEFSAKLTILGHTSEKSFTQMYKNILSVRNAYGLTSEQIDDIIAITTKYAVVTGASTKQIENATLALSRFTSQLTSAGVESSKVTEILEGMLDPDKLMDNVVLMNKLGISVNDMISGDPTTKLEASTEKLKQLGQEIMGIAKSNRMQANEMAKIYGITLEDARQFAEIDTSDKAINTQKQLEQYQSEMQTFTKSLESLKNMIAGVVSGPLSFIGNIIQRFTDALNILPRGVSALLGGLLVRKLVRGLAAAFGDRLVQYAKKWNQPFSETMEKYLKSVGVRGEEKQKDIEANKPASEQRRNPEEVLGRAGFALNVRANAEDKAEARNSRKIIKEKTKGKFGYNNIEPGEFIEELQKRISETEEIKKAIEELEKGSAGDQEKAKRYRNRYEGVLDSLDEFKDLLNKSINISWGSNTKEEVTRYNNLSNSEKGRKGQFKGLLNSFNSDLFGKDESKQLDFKSGTEAENAKVAGIISGSNNPKEALEALKEFYNTIGGKAAKENIEKIDAQLKEYNEQIEKQAKEILPDATEKLQIYDKTIANARSGKGVLFKEKAKDVASGLASRVGGGVGSALSALGPWGAVAGAVLGLAAGFARFASKNEKVAKSIEQAKKVIDGIKKKIAEKLEPIFTAISNAISSAAKFLGGTFNVEVEDISKNVSSISDSYKQEDLATMTRGVGEYNAMTDTLAAKLDNMYYEIYNFKRTVKDGMDTANDMTAYRTSQNI